MKISEPTELLARPRSLLIAAVLIAATITYLAMNMAAAVMNFRSMFKELGLVPSPVTELVFKAPGVWWVFAVASIAVLVWVAAQSQITTATKRRMKMAMFLTVATTVLTYGITAYAIYPPLFELNATV
jgi:hypothetical protein